MRLVTLAATLATAAAASQPNIILLMTDDQDIEMGSLAYMPKLQSLIADAGYTFNHMYASTPVCCPSRSALVSGQYQHNNMVVGNSIAGNCSSPAWQTNTEVNGFATYLKQAGYATSFAGKYLNMYGMPVAGGVAHIPPGWTNWQGLVGNSVYYNYVISNNGVAEKHGNDYEADYLPNVVLNKTLAFLDEYAGQQPFFAMVSPPACHGPADPAPQYATLYPGAHAPRTPAFNAEVNHTHWIQEVQAVYGLDNNSEGFLDLVFRRRVQTLASVDDIIESLVNKLTALNQLDNTYFIYTTDNGYHLGHYGLIYDKRQPWETDVHLPLFVRGPGIPAGKSTDSLVSMPDISATILDIAGAAIPPQFDGSSILPFMTDSADSAAPVERQMVLVEYHGETGNGGGAGPASTNPCNRTGNTLLFCNPDGTYAWPPFWNGNPVCVCQDSANNTYSCLRVRNATSNFRYCEFTDSIGTIEYFDYVADPFELVNLAPTMDPTLQSALHTTLAAATSCKGTGACNAVLTSVISVPDVEASAASLSKQ